MIVDNVWKLTNTVRVGLDARSWHVQRQSTFPDNVWSYCPPCHGVSHCENWTTFLFFLIKQFPSLVQKWMTRVGNLWVTRLRPRVWSQLWYSPVWTYLRCPRGTRRNTSLIRWRTNDGLKTIILSSKMGWRGFPDPKDDTWEPLGHLSGSEHMIREFNEQWEKRMLSATIWRWELTTRTLLDSVQLH